MAFDGEAFVARFNTVWNGHDLDGILAMMTDDVVFEASFGKDPWGRVSSAGRRCASSSRTCSGEFPTFGGTRSGTLPAPSWPWSSG